jgi:hypothetical protein
MRAATTVPSRTTGATRATRAACAAALATLMLCGCAMPAAGRGDCPRAAAELAPEALYGRWEARFDGVPDTAQVEFARHPEYAGSVRGTLRRAGAAAATTAQLAGDVDDAGALTLDESGDGRAIDAVWSADLDPASCGDTFRGTRRASADDRTQAFVLHRTRPLP